MPLSPLEVENLAALLASPMDENLGLGFEILRQYPEVTPQLLAPLMLIRHFKEEGETASIQQWKAELGVLLNSYLDPKTIKTYDQHFLVFQWVRQHYSKRWGEFRQHLLLFEAHFDDYEPYILHNPAYLQRYYELSEYLRRQYKKPGAAFPYMKKVMKLQPKDPNLKIAYVDLMINHLFIKKVYLEEANQVVQELKDLAQIYPSYAYQYYHLIGIVYDLYLMDKSAAKSYCLKCLEQYPEHESALNNLANIYFKFDRNYTKALELAEQSVAIQKDIHSLDTLACIEFLGFKRLDRAEKLLREAMKIKMTHHPSLTLLGEVLAAKGEYTEAQIWYERGLKLSKTSEYKLTLLAELLYFKLKDYPAALKAVQRLLKYHPENYYAQHLHRKIRTTLPA